jgi:hypothetical protein
MQVWIQTLVHRTLVFSNRVGYSILVCTRNSYMRVQAFALSDLLVRECYYSIKTNFDNANAVRQCQRGRNSPRGPDRKNNFVTQND